MASTRSSVVFLGTSPFAVPCLRALASDPRFSIDLVITQPDRPVGRKQIMTPPPIKIAADQLQLPIAQPENIGEAISDQSPEANLAKSGRSVAGGEPRSKRAIRRPDYLVVVSYGQILPQSILDWPTIAPVNVHASLLPKLRGASPLQHAILGNFKATGVTVQRMVKELDAGPVLSQRSISIDERETFQSLHDKLAAIGADLLIETLINPLKDSPQNDPDATFCKKLSRADGIADPKTMDAETIDRMVRALTPWPGVSVNGNKILETSLIPLPDSMPLSCAGNSTLHILTIQPPSRKPMTGRAFARGHTVLS
ncbi:MAG: methionyl-tRNA formyltransferase [Candidatus Peribacteraceae bacterium]|nr:methionyl-tRNA formyltransferase [Candidatus Peribacteraceae bacterium]